MANSRTGRHLVVYQHPEHAPDVLRVTVFRDHVYDRVEDARAACLLLQIEFQRPENEVEPGDFLPHRTRVATIRLR